MLDRVPVGESVVTGPSRCPHCGRRLNAVDLVPVAGYLVRRGRCASCGVRIPARYPMYEAASGALFGVSVLLLGPWTGLGAGLAALAAATALGLIMRARTS